MACSGLKPQKENPEAPLWVGSQGGLSHRSPVTHMLDKYTIRACLDPVNSHALRHTFATRYLNAKPSELCCLARLLGHMSLDKVMIYMEPNLDDLSARLE